MLLLVSFILRLVVEIEILSGNVLFEVLKIFTVLNFLMSWVLVLLSPLGMMGVLLRATIRSRVRMVSFAARLFCLEHIHGIALYLKFWHTFFKADLIT